MQSSLLVFVNLLLASGGFVSVLGYPFKFLPRAPQTIDRLADDRSVDRQMMLQTNSLVSPMDYDARQLDTPAPVKQWLKITQHPVSGLEVTAGTRVVLECKASGSPPPEVFWFSGSGSKEQMSEYLRASTVDAYESGDDWNGVARVVSKLAIECATPEDAGLIYCAAVSPRKIVISKPTVLIVNGERGNVNCSSESEPTITMYSPTRVANMGSSVVLPCRASGRPMPQITWVDNFNVPVGLSTNPRHRVLNNGDLLIETLLWEDMGGYICKAKTGHREEVVDTFLYPLRPENEQDRTVN